MCLQPVGDHALADLLYSIKNPAGRPGLEFILLQYCLSDRKAGNRFFQVYLRISTAILKRFFQISLRISTGIYLSKCVESTSNVYSPTNSLTSLYSHRS
jgi:hypothetical protein